MPRDLLAMAGELPRLLRLVVWPPSRRVCTVGELDRFGTTPLLGSMLLKALAVPEAGQTTLITESASPKSVRAWALKSGGAVPKADAKPETVTGSPMFTPVL